MTDKPINPYDAPDGMVARRAVNGCAGCVFEPMDWATCREIRCIPEMRPDGGNVIFTPRAEPGE